ncbi:MULTISPECIES: protoporphyrinogen oxidase HemJ [Rhizobium/Agrobacterium group]|uniref:Protoporphyrinogen IX oxidase n=2 Tax=Neorhizobium TaxID=1525371 RepID=A0ABV0M8L1_9HYPH|nr:MULTISPECIES: protoporphyrinogen oxidase HemJ [Rhizobium/Agrobacterium group]KGD95633.1 membrane protein [Rhizobium sp. YS-1r]MCC2612806.1 protoporphyrinogen oxidase HemJ [Neorhizobium petrolearium]WGI67918.1 protoporphyrinogen oxidase HemJ [Neorhizobium petrolearium]
MNASELQSGRAAGRRSAVRAFVALVVFIAILAAVYLVRPDDFVLYIKAFHVIAVISWMAGLLYMPRLFIYHSDAEPGSAHSETFKMMEQRLLKIIMNPAMMITWVLGLFLAWDVYGFRGGWLHAKIGLVILLTLVHVLFGRAVRNFAVDGHRKSPRYWRMMNELPTVLMIGIVILVIVKPF